MALKNEFIGLAAMAEIPLVIVDVQRGGPSTGLPAKVEQGDLLMPMCGSPGDAPRIVIAAATIEECFHRIITARKLAEAFRMPAIVHTDANLATSSSKQWFNTELTVLAEGINEHRQVQWQDI
jgi:2-oxoglutarate ferredoxin oxidoreductase subunit alpha